MTLPIVTRETAITAICDLTREMAKAEEMEDVHGGALMDAVLVVARENPQILESVSLMTSECSEQERMSALVGMAITYRALKAQAEMEAPERLVTL